jgi:glycosyltransferase involved in cell wall biosynthesis
MAECLEALDQVDTRRRMGREARRLAEDFPWERTVAELERLYDDLVSGRI